MQTTARTHEPLETLVIAQIAALKQHEQAIQKQFQAGQTLQTTAVASALHSLQQRADRLNRMLDAMSAVPLGMWNLAPNSEVAA